jgi:hypothetical protein
MVLEKCQKYPGFFMQSYTMPHGWTRDFMEFWASKRSKYMQNFDFLPLFELQKAVLGELIFEGSNELQIQKFQLGWKVDSRPFQ